MYLYLNKSKFKDQRDAEFRTLYMTHVDIFAGYKVSSKEKHTSQRSNILSSPSRSTG